MLKYRINWMTCPINMSLVLLKRMFQNLDDTPIILSYTFVSYNVYSKTTHNRYYTDENGLICKCQIYEYRRGRVNLCGGMFALPARLGLCCPFGVQYTQQGVIVKCLRTCGSLWGHHGRVVGRYVCFLLKMSFFVV